MTYHDEDLRVFVFEYHQAVDFSLDDEDKGAEWSNELTERALSDCAKFLRQNYDTIKGTGKDNALIRAAHDFWFTRNEYGVGFWDGDWPEDVGDELTKSAHEFGQCEVYTGDDGLLYAI